MMQRWRELLRHERLQVPLAIIIDTYRPLAFFASELVLAAAPFLPTVVIDWAGRQQRQPSPSEERP